MEGGAAAALVILFVLFGIGSLAVWIWALVDVVRVPDDSMFKAGNKLIWVLVVVLAGLIGAIVYLIVGRPAPGARAAVPPSTWGQPSAAWPGQPPPSSPGQAPAPPPPPPGAVG